MNINVNIMIETLTGIFTILILSQSVQGVIGSRLQDRINRNTSIKHLILIFAIYRTGLYKIINFDYLRFLNHSIIKSVIVWLLLLFFLKLHFNYILIIICILVVNKGINDYMKNGNFKKKTIQILNISLTIVYLFGIYNYLYIRNPKSMFKSMMDTIND